MTEATQAIEDLEAKLAAATPGEWLARYDDRITRSDDTDGTKSIMHVYGGKRQCADRALTVALHNAAPALLALAKAAEELQGHFNSDGGRCAYTPKGPILKIRAALNLLAGVK